MRKNIFLLQENIVAVMVLTFLSTYFRKNIKRFVKYNWLKSDIF